MDDATKAKGPASSRNMIVVLAAGLFVVMGIAILGAIAIGFDRIADWILLAWQTLKDAPPIVFFGAMSILTIFPVPLTPFYIAAGSIYGIVPSLLWIPPAIVLNNWIAYTLTTGFLRPRLQALVAKRGYSIPTLVSKREQTFFITMVRITPGPPYFLQSLVLGLAGVDRTRFLVLSLPIHMIFVVGFVVLGRSAFDGELGLAVAAVALILAASIFARFALKRLRAASDLQLESKAADVPLANSEAD